MNVPKIRFKNYEKEWKKTTLKNVAIINPKNEQIPNEFIYIDLESVNKGILSQEKIISKSSAPSRAQRTIKKNDILFQTVRPYQQNNYFVKETKELPYIASTGYALIRTSEDPYFIYSILHKKDFLDKVIDRCTGTSFPAISANDLGDININIPDIKEQMKVSNFLSLLDKKIELQTKKIEDLKLFKKGLLKKNYYKIANNNLTELSCIANIYQPQTISQSELDNGKYYVFGANGIIGKYSKFNHKFMQVTISCRGENSGTINLTPDECWITGNSMVLNVDENKNVDKLYLKNILEAQNLKYLISGSGQPQIVRSSVLKHKIPYISIEQQKKFTIPFIKLDSKIKLEQNKLDKLQELKKGLMQSMFV